MTQGTGKRGPGKRGPGSWGVADSFADACPNATDPNHRTGPTGYNARADWAENMLRTHVQGRCPRCELWVVWTPK